MDSYVTIWLALELIDPSFSPSLPLSQHAQSSGIQQGFIMVTNPPCQVYNLENRESNRAYVTGSCLGMEVASLETTCTSPLSLTLPCQAFWHTLGAQGRHPHSYFIYTCTRR